MLMRVDEVYFNAEFTTKNEIGVDPLFKFDFELARIFYIHVLLTGKAVFFNEDGEPIDKTGIPNEPGRRIIQQHYIISAYHKSIIMNNKAMKRTGFIEYSQKSNCMDLRYFDALGNKPDDRYSIANAPLSQLTQIYTSIDNGKTVQVSIITDAGEQILLVHGYDKYGNLIVAECDSLADAGKINIQVCSQVFWDGRQITMRSWFEFRWGELSSENGNIFTSF